MYCKKYIKTFYLRIKKSVWKIDFFPIAMVGGSSGISKVSDNFSDSDTTKTCLNDGHFIYF